MVVGDIANSYSSTSGGDLWNYGKEVWCNKPGQYITLEADLSSLIGAYEMTICQLGIFGTEYVRANSIPTQIKLLPYDTSSPVLQIDHITSSYTIGNTLNIKVRVRNGASFPWVAVSCLALDSFCQVTFTNTGLVSGQQQIVLESYDDNGSVKSSLKEDIVTVCFDCITFSRSKPIITTYIMAEDNI